MPMLPYLLLILSFFQFSASNTQQDCSKETGIAYETLQKEFYDFQTSYNNDVVGKFFACFWKKNGVMNGEGIVNKDAFIDYFTEFAHINRNNTAEFVDNDMVDFDFEQNEQVDAIRVVNCVKIGFFALTFADREPKDLLKMMMT
uniref:EF-hand domain-containing protein n=1 Tax=Photinus pyralis TaxID=7054 RepID=A0A1Y1KGR4_PHOPY